MFTQEMSGIGTATWNLPSFSADQLDTSKYKYRWRWVGQGGGTGAINDEQEALIQYQQYVPDSACLAEFYVNGSLTKSYSDSAKSFCAGTDTTGPPPVTPPPVTPPSFYQKHKTAVLVGGGALAAVTAVGAVLLVRRKK